MNWRVNWRGLINSAQRRRRHAIRVFAVAAAVFIAPPAWPQNEGSVVPNPENALNSSTVSGFLARFSRPQVAQAAPRMPQKHTSRIRVSRAKVSRAAPAPAPEPAISVPPSQAQVQPEWPNAQDNVGVAGLVPIEIRTVREMMRTEPDTALVQENELSDLDMAARAPAIRDEPELSTDGSANGEEGDLRGNRIAAFAENLKAVGGASWLEPLLLALAGAIAAITAMRVFAA